MRSLRIVAVLLTLATSAVASARQEIRSTQTFEAGIDLVQVDVSVLDKNRRPIRGLTATDFTLLEDGHPRPVAAFTAVALPSPPAMPKVAWVRDVPPDVTTNDAPDEGRLVVILMDRSIPIGLPAGTAHNVARAAIEQLAPGDLAAVVYTGSGAPQDFTNDRATLLAAIGENPAAGLSPDASRHWQTQQDRLEAEIWSVEDALRGIPKVLPANISGECQCGLCVLDAIKTIADAVRDTQGRKKSLLFIGTDIITDVMTIGKADPATDPCYYPVTDGRTAMFSSLDMANLTVHAFDVNGLESGVTASSSSAGVFSPISPREGAQTSGAASSEQRLIRHGHLAVLPDRTGGRTVKNTNSPEDRVADVFRESESYYLLGFEPATSDGREHTISVRVNRRDAIVQSRRAYVAEIPSRLVSTTAADRARNAILGPISGRNGITLTANAFAVAAPVTHSPTLIVALHGQHDASAESFAAGSETVDIVTSVFTMDGRAMGTFNQTVQVTPRAGSGDAGVAYDVLQRMVAKPGRYELRIGVSSASRKQSGSVYTLVNVQSFMTMPFAWSDVGLSAASLAPPADDGFSELVPVLPIARRVFDRQEHVTAFLSAYHMSGSLPTPITISTRIVDEQNRRRFQQEASLSASDFEPSQTAAYTVDLPLATLDPGEHLLTMEMAAGKTKTTRQVRFAVR